MLRRAKGKLFAAWLALSVALVAGGALAHELDHTLHKHDIPCALHLYAGHGGGIAPSAVAVGAVSPMATPLGTALTRAVAQRPIFRYAVRGPPRLL